METRAHAAYDFANATPAARGAAARLAVACTAKQPHPLFSWFVSVEEESVTKSLVASETCAREAEFVSDSL